MKRIAMWLMVVALVAIVAGPVAAQEKEKKGKRNQLGQNPAIKALTEQLKSLDLSEDQSAKIKELTAGVSEKLAAINKERTALIGEEGVKKMAAARKEATDAGKKGKELQEAVNAAADLSEEQIAKLKAIQAKQQAIVTELKKVVAASLTEEQRAKAGLNAPAKRKKDKSV